MMLLGKHLDPVLVLLGRVVVILPGETDLVLGCGQLFLQGKEILIGLEVGVGLGHGEERTQGLGEDVFDLGPILHAAGRN